MTGDRLLLRQRLSDLIWIVGEIDDGLVLLSTKNAACCPPAESDAILATEIPAKDIIGIYKARVNGEPWLLNILDT